MYSEIFEHILLPMVEWKYSMSVRKHLRELEETQWWPIDQLQEFQNERLRRLIIHAYEKVPYYRRIFQKYGLKSADIRSVDDLPRMPVLTKEKIRNNFESMLSSDFTQRKQKLDRTGGSTGEPLQFYIDWEAWSMSWACSYLGWRFAGYRFGDKMATLGGFALFSDKKEMTFQQRIRLLLDRDLAMSAIHLSDDVMSEYSRLIERHQPKFIKGYPSAIYIFASYLKRNGLCPIEPKAVITTAEVLLPRHREVIEEVFKCKVFDWYGCSDGGGSALECPQHNGYHVPMQRVVIELVNEEGQPVRAGEPGRIILTDLFNYSMPFIRYDPGDIGIPDGKTCPCGRGLPLLKSLQGRTSDIIRFNNGTTLFGRSFTNILKHFPILQFQVVQLDMENILIRIVKGNEYRGEDSNYIIKTMEHHIGRQGSVQLEFVEDIVPTKAGKRLFVISNVS
jgi:phenylacetate-CoA ligase